MVGEVIWALGMVAWYVIRRPFERKAKRLRVVRTERTSAENAGLAAAIAGMAVVPAIYVAFDWPRLGSYAQPLWAVMIGAASLGCGLWLFYRSHKDLGRNWSISLEIREAHTLVTGGVYRRLRHPMYTSFLLIAIAQSFLVPSPIAGLAGLVGFAALYLPRVGKEERMMTETFGEDYARYADRTKRLVPYVY